MGGGRTPKEHKTVSKNAIDLFTDRTEPQKSWDTYRELDHGNTDVIHYYGEGGIGKSTLLKKIMDDLIKQENHNVIMYSFEATQDKADFLSAMAREIGARIPDADFSIFYHAYTTYLKSLKMSEEEIEQKLTTNKSGVYVTESLKFAVNVGADLVSIAMPIPLGNTMAKAGEKLINLIAYAVSKICSVITMKQKQS